MKHLRQIASGILWLPYGAILAIWCIAISPFLLAALLFISFTNRFGPK